MKRNIYAVKNLVDHEFDFMIFIEMKKYKIYILKSSNSYINNFVIS